MTPQTPQFPPLPEPEYKQAIRAGFIPGGEYVEQRPAFSADQMRDYARAALEAQKSERDPNVLLIALRKLACLGNGDKPGNSLGNEIAKLALEIWATAQPQAQKAEHSMTTIARRNLRQFVSKASFSSQVDKQAAIEWLDCIDAALGSAGTDLFE